MKWMVRGKVYMQAWIEGLIEHGPKDESQGMEIRCGLEAFYGLKKDFGTVTEVRVENRGGVKRLSALIDGHWTPEVTLDLGLPMNMMMHRRFKK
jgi:hypothetical protein